MSPDTIYDEEITFIPVIAEVKGDLLGIGNDWDMGLNRVEITYIHQAEVCEATSHSEPCNASSFSSTSLCNNTVLVPEDNIHK